MAIDKIFPKNLNTDAEERLLQKGTMTDAMNITISEDGEGSASIAKNVKGTIPGEPLSNADKVLNNKRIVAIGSASDSQRGFIYYIVADAGYRPLKNENAIYQYDVTNDTYRVVLKDRRLNFDPESFIKIDVVNGDFARSGGLQTVLFFTDNTNPPRKINVDRAIAGAYSDINQREFDYSLNCIKAPSVYEPTAAFTTDFNIDTNLFTDEAFQFATQIIYEDGEESAISPYSKLIIPTQLTVHNVGEIGYGLSATVDNVCIVNPNLNAEDFLSSPDISKLRILFRVGNIGAFNIADELPLNVPTNRSVNGTSVTVFDGSSHFRFYNDRVVTPVAPSEVNKLFDNVPFQAKGQAVSGNRLMYSNYTEGRENTPASAALNVKYKKASLVRSELINQADDEFDETGEADIPTISITPQSVNGGAGITVKLKEAFGLEGATAEELDSYVIEAGTIVNMSVEAPMNIPEGVELPVGFDFVAKYFGEDYTAPDAEAVECPVHISSIEIHTLDQQETINPINSGLYSSAYYPLDQYGNLKIPTIDLTFVVSNNMPFMSSTGGQDFFNIFIGNLENVSFQGTYYAKIKGTQGLMYNFRNLGYQLNQWNEDGYYPNEPMFYSAEQPLGDTTANGNILDLVTPPEPIYTGTAGAPDFQELISPYLPTNYTTIVTNPLTGRDGFAESWQKEGAGAVELNFNLRIEANPNTGDISADIIPVSFAPYAGGQTGITSPVTGTPLSAPENYTRASGILLVCYPHWEWDLQLTQWTSQKVIPFTVPDSIPIDWPEGEAMPVNGGFLNNTVSGLSVPVNYGGAALADNYPDIDFSPTYELYYNGGPAIILPPYPNTLESGGALLQQVENFFLPHGSSLFEKKLSAVVSSQVSGFKAGAVHNFGVVYYDKFNRSGFVNEIGSSYVEWFNKDGDDFRGDKTDPFTYLDGPAAIEVKINSDPPEWAETYQIVYPGNASVSDFVQYTVGGCFPARVKHDVVVVGESDSYSSLPARNIDTQSKRLYVSLETLEQYKADKNTVRDYSYNEGDKLRVISLKNEIGTSISLETDEDDLESIYKGASDKTIIEFDVVGVEVLAKDLDNPIAFNPLGGALSSTSAGDALTSIPDFMTGTFLVLEASSIAGGAFGEDQEILKFPGFDWNHVSAYYRETTATQDAADTNVLDFDYLDAGDNAPDPVNSWRQRCLVEILTPKLSSENEFYYEIGERRHIGKYNPPFPFNVHGPAFILDSGDINYRPVPCKTLFFNEDATDASASFKDDVKDYVYKIENLESLTVSDKLSEKAWSRGRPHVKYNNAATFRRFNGVTYSDAYAEDVDRLSLSSFNATLANFYSLDSQYGACNYISNYGSEQRGFDELLSIQENKFSKTPVNKSIILDASGANNVALSTNVLTTSTYYTGDYGCGDHPESVLVQDNDVYFFDRSRKKVLRFSGNQLVPISDAGVSSTINDTTDAFNKVFNRKSGKVVSGYNPDDNVYYITFHYPQALSYDSGEELKLVPLYLTTDWNQDGSVTDVDAFIFANLFQQILDGEIAVDEAAALVDVSFQALDPDNPNVFTLSNAATFDVTSSLNLYTPDGFVSQADYLLSQTQLGEPSAVNEVIDGVTYVQYVNIHDADGNPIPVMANNQPVFVNVETNEIVFENGVSIEADLSSEGSDLFIPYNEEYGEFVTLSYNANGSFWQSKNSYYPDVYANQDNKMYTAKYVIDSAILPPLTDGNALMFHRHEDLKTEGDTVLNRCTFYNQSTSESFIEVVSNINPSGVKVYDALSYEGNSAAFKASVESFLGNKKGMTNVSRLDFVNKEGSYYSAIGGDISENSTNHIRPLGYVVGVEENQIIINDAPAGAIQGSVLKTVSNIGVLSNIGVIPEEEITIEGGMETVANGVSINVSGEIDESIVGSTVVMELPRERDGDSIRGHYAKIKLSTEEGQNVGKYELFCVNAHVTPSDLHHVN